MDTDERSLWKSMRTGVGPLAMAALAALGVAASIDFVNERDSRAQKNDARRTALSAQPTNTASTRVVAVRKDGTAVVVHDLRVGDDVGVPVAAPAGTRFHQVAREGNGYLVSAYAAGEVTFHRLRQAADGRPQELNELPRLRLRGVSGAWSDMSVAADGRIAYVTYLGSRPRINVITPRTGARRTWTTSLTGRIDSLSWAGDTLSYVWRQRWVRAVDTVGPGGDLKAGRVVLTLPDGGTAALLGRDTRTVVTLVGERTGLSVWTYATATGKRVGTVWQRRLNVPTRPDRLTRDRTGEYLLVGAADGRLFAGLPGGVREVAAPELGDLAW